MKFQSSFLPGQYHRNPLVLLGFLCFVVVLAYVSVNYALGSDTFGLLAVLVVVLGGAATIVILNDWRRGLYLFIAWLVFEDLLRKFLGNNMTVYFGKDVLAALIYISFLAALRRREIRTIRPPFLAPLLLFIWFGIIQIFNFTSPSLVFGLLGFKLYFYYVPMFFVGYAFFQSETDLRRFYSLNAFLALLIAGLGIAQSILGPSFLNPSVLQEDIRGLSTLYRYAPISGVAAYRPNSVFVGTGRYGDYLILSTIVILGFCGYLLLRYRRGRTLAFVSLAVVCAGAVMTASRGSFLWTLGIVLTGSAAFLWGAPWRQREASRIIRAIPRIGLALGLAFAGLIYAYPQEIGSRFAIYSETLMPDSPASELAHRTWYYPLDNLLKAFQYPRWPYGYGIGTTSLGLQYVSRILNIPRLEVGVESGYGNLIVELGIAGLLLWIFWTFAVVFSSWRVVLRLRGTPWFPLSFMIFFYAFLLLIPMSFFSFVAYQDFILNSYLWLLLGILFRLPEIARAAQAEAVQPAGQRRA